MLPKQYDAWYNTQRGKWIGEEEYRLIVSMLAPLPGETLLDVGCGTGYFTRQFANDAIVRSVIGVDADFNMIRFASEQSNQGINFMAADACKLPFRDKSFDLVVSVTALCFIREEKAALQEMLRVTKRQVVLGLLNRHSILYFQKGLGGGTGGYRGAHWHTRKEASFLFDGLTKGQVSCRTIIVLTSSKRWVRQIEARLRRWLPGCGAFIAVSAMV
ncbi:MAG: class I SAM-dependent methyltransferase [Burkholderiales bacterium]|nr:class I SAM-dependent methyltransferase [Burkholderiales bacterium]